MRWQLRSKKEAVGDDAVVRVTLTFDGQGAAGSMEFTVDEGTAGGFVTGKTYDFDSTGPVQ